MRAVRQRHWITPTLGAAIVLVIGLACGVVNADDKADSSNPGGVPFFEARIRPVLVNHCYDCHSVQAGKAEGGLLVDNRAGLSEGGDSGPAVRPGDVDGSLLISALRHEEFEMPLDQPQLDSAVIADFARWVEAGATDPREGPVGTIGNPALTSEQREYWAFQPPHGSPPPPVHAKEWPVNIVDRFVLAKLEDNGLAPAPDASKRDLIRRLYYDLLGLPPRPAEIARFVADGSPHAYTALVDRLLSSQHYGEKWGQVWLDTVRFAESEGFEYDRHLPDAWRYRDYVIQSMNDDKPFDQFVREQVAGDEMEPVTHERLIAAGFHRLGPVRRNAGNPDIVVSRNEVLTERTDIIGSAILGLTIGCARCHDHKFDPITQYDYYSLQAFLATSHEHNEIIAPEADRRHWEARSQDLTQQIEGLEKEFDKAEGAERMRIGRRISELKDRLPPPLPTITSIRNDEAAYKPIHILKRGMWERKGALVNMRPPSVLTPEGTVGWPQRSPSPRLRLAEWLTRSDNPLTARVIVNRIWQGHFGQGLVKTANDFGQNGDRPSHPELLDELTVRFVQNGWRMKPLHRLIVTSRTYRQSSRIRPTERAVTIDPENRLLWRFDRRRLTAEEIRDSMLTVSGRLNTMMYGESVMLPVAQSLVDLLYKPSQWLVTQDPRQHDRRSIYLVAKRNLRMPFMEVFDQPTSLGSCAVRGSSTHAPQSLELLNGRISNRLADHLAARLVADGGDSVRQQIELAYELVAGRSPTPLELRLAAEFLRTQPLREFALSMFNLNAFLYVR